MKSLPRTLLALYLLILLWLVLFKFSYDLLSVLLHYQSRGLNLIPFAYASRSEMISNLVVFVPFGLLLSMNFKRVTFWRKLAAIFAFSVVIEIIQYIFAIGVTDITDIIMNTLGGLLGLAGYAFCSKYIDSEKLDRFIIVAGIFIVILFFILRLFIFKVRY